MVSYRSFPLVLCSVALCGCVSISSFQSARTLKSGELGGQFGVGYESMKFNKPSSDSGEEQIKKTIENVKAPLLEAGFRVGVVERFDLGIKYTVPGTFGVDGKLMLIGKGGSFALSPGLGVGYATFQMSSSSASTDSTATGTSSSSSGGLKTTYTLTDIHAPLYMSIDITKAFTLYAAPRYILRTVTVKESDGKKSKGTGSLVGLTVGANVYWFVAEAGYFTAAGSNNEAGIYQVMVGYWGGWDLVTR